jgi:hypothetical protein
MKIEFLKESDYETLCEWWKGWKWEVPTKDFLPENGLGGLMVYSDSDEPVCAGFVYFTNSKVAWMEFIISDPNYKGEDRNHLIDILINALLELIKEKGYKFAFTLAKHKYFQDRLLDSVFIFGEKETAEMVYVCSQ